MRKLLTVLLLSAVSWATTTVTGTIKNLGTGNLTNGAFVRFWLRGCAGNQPRITGTAIVGPSQGGVYYFDFSANGSGLVSGSLYSTRDSVGTGNGDIECGGVYTSVWYGMQVFVAGKGGPEMPVHAKSGATLDISTVTPITTNPVVIAPTGDTTYARIDGGNQPFNGSVSPSGNGTLNMGFANNRWVFFGSSLDISGASTLTGAITAGSTATVAGLLTSQLGAVVNVSGTGCADSLELVNIDTTPTNPNKIFRVNRTTGALELVNSACSTVITSIDDSGNGTFNGNLTLLGTSLSGGTTSNTSTPNTFTMQSVGTYNPGGGGTPKPGTPMTLKTPDGGTPISGTSVGGTLNITTGANCTNSTCSPAGQVFGHGVINLNSFIQTYNNIGTVAMGVPVEVALVDLTAQNAAITTTTLYTDLNFTPANGATAVQYSLGWNAKVTTAAGVSSTLGALTIVYTDPDGVAITVTAPAAISAGTIATTSTGNTTSTVLLGLPLTLNVKAGTAITYAFAYASNAANAMQYNLHLRLELK